MENCYSDTKYYNLVCDIINNKEFKKINSCVHHGISRLEHSCRVSYYSYKVSKILKLNYKEVARAGLLHDFFLSKNITKKEKIKSMFTHPEKSLKNSEKHFILSNKEKNIIYSHMFPLNINIVPRYKESWVVSIVDKVVATYEFSYTFKTNMILKHHNVMLILLIIGRIL